MRTIPVLASLALSGCATLSEEYVRRDLVPHVIMAGMAIYAAQEFGGGSVQISPCGDCSPNPRPSACPDFNGDGKHDCP